MHKLHYLSETQNNFNSVQCFQEKFLNRQRVPDYTFFFFKRQENAPRIAIIVSIMIYVYPRY